MNRMEATLAGQRYYQGEKPCKHGHALDRYASTGACVGCIARGKQRYNERFIERGRGRERLDQVPVAADMAQALRWFAGETLALTRRPDVEAVCGAILGLHKASGGAQSPQRDPDVHAPMTPERKAWIHAERVRLLGEDAANREYVAKPVLL